VVKALCYKPDGHRFETLSSCISREQICEYLCVAASLQWPVCNKIGITTYLSRHSTLGWSRASARQWTGLRLACGCHPHLVASPVRSLMKRMLAALPCSWGRHCPRSSLRYPGFPPQQPGACFPHLTHINLVPRRQSRRKKALSCWRNESRGCPGRWHHPPCNRYEEQQEWVNRCNEHLQMN
jgi:hypothetical protein